MDIALRLWSPGDLAQLVKHGDNRNIAAHMADGFPSPYTPDEGEKFIRRATGDDPTKIFAIVYHQEVIGSIGIFPDTDIHRKNAAIAYWIAEPFWGKGVASEAIRKIVHYGFSTFDIIRIYAKPFGTNRASQRALEKAGFKLEATLEKTIFKNGTLLDEMIYSIRRE